MAKSLSVVAYTMILIYIFLCLISCLGLDLQHKKIIIRSLKMCKGKENLPMRWTDATIKYNEETKEANFNLKLTVTQEISDNFEMTFSFLKCDSSGNPSTCEYRVKDYRNSEVCKYVMMKNQAWSIFVEHFDKPLVCPLKPGEYRVVNCPIKPDFLRLIPVSDAVWKVNIWGFDNGKANSCVDMEMQIKPFLGKTNNG